jgi:hypothetical protein
MHANARKIQQSSARMEELAEADFAPGKDHLTFGKEAQPHARTTCPFLRPFLPLPPAACGCSSPVLAERACSHALRCKAR